MRLQVKGKNVEVSDSIREYAEKKLAKLERRQPRPILPDAIDRSCLRHSGFGTHSVTPQKIPAS